MLNKIIEWAQKDDAIRAAILTGSRAGKQQSVDRFSDFDIALFVSDPQKYTRDDAWIHALGNVSVSIPEKVDFDNQKIPTRLIVFEGGVGADISLWPADYLDTLIIRKQLPFACECAYSILIDKDNKAQHLPTALGKRNQATQPSQEEFASAVKVFFFEVFNCAKYIVRGDLWHAKLRDWTTKEYLLRMIEWHAHAMHGPDYDTFWHGKNMSKWVDKDIWAALGSCFGRFDAVDSHKALMATVSLFRNLAMQTAEKLGYEYSKNIDESISQFIRLCGGHVKEVAESGKHDERKSTV